MISYRKADLIDRLKSKPNSKKRIIYFFDDDRYLKKYYDLNTDHIVAPAKNIDIPFREMYGPEWKLFDFDICTVALDNAEANKRLGQDVYCNEEIVGVFERVTLDGMMSVVDGENERLIDPTEYCIYKKEGFINIEAASL